MAKFLVETKESRTPSYHSIPLLLEQRRALAIKFWSLDESNRNNIDLSYSGPHYIFIPIQNGQVLVDYAWIIRRLHDLFFGINIRAQNFKGNALENIVRKSKSALPTGPCKSFTRERRQIDYAFPFDDYLVIAECKAVSMSIGFDRVTCPPKRRKVYII